MKGLLAYKAVLSCIGGIYIMLTHDGVFAAQQVRDPTQPLLQLLEKGDQVTPKSTETPETVVRLQGVIDRNGQRVALINNQVMVVGQVIDGYELKSISPYGAELEREDEGLSLSLYRIKIKNDEPSDKKIY